MRSNTHNKANNQDKVKLKTKAYFFNSSSSFFWNSAPSLMIVAAFNLIGMFPPWETKEWFFTVVVKDNNFTNEMSPRKKRKKTSD